MSRSQVVISGGGPVGLICAYALARRGVTVTVLDQNSELQDDPRAATTHPATLELLDGLGVIDQVIEQGLIAEDFEFWDRPTGEKIATFDHAVLVDDTKFPFVVQCEQFKLAKIFLAKLQDETSVTVLFNHDVTGFDHTADGVTVTASTPDGEKTFEGDWLIGADGGRSVVRKSAGIGFEGFTWAERFLVLSTPFDFKAERGMSFRNYIADPDEWCNCFKVAADGPPGLWRLVFPADPEANEEALLADDFVQEKMQKFFKRDSDYDIVHRNLYNVHQRVASTFRLGRILLAGDSAHVNNSIGGMGLNGGIQDAVNLTDKLAAVIIDGEDERLMDLYDKQRRTYAVEFVQEQTIANKKRLEATDPEARAANMKNLREMAGDPAKARNFLLGATMISAMRRNAEMTLEDA
ncbi:MAG: FAD-dependent oxidoreductase [Alphaproteobacteria bacterium]|nr:FAD-dependent oxidoreductase [Alphaproteobacteria bacterium]